MTFSHVQTVKLSGETFALDGNLQVATTSLEKDGCLLLKGATDLRPIEPSMEARYSQKGFKKTSEDDGSLDIGSTLDSVARDVYLNRVSGYAALQIFLTAVQGHWRYIVLCRQRIHHHLLQPFHILQQNPIRDGA